MEHGRRMPKPKNPMEYRLKLIDLSAGRIGRV